MVKRLLLGLLICLTFASSLCAQFKQRIITARNNSVRPHLTLEPESGNLMLTWYEQRGAQEIDHSRINAALINPETLKSVKSLNVNQPSGNAYFSPHFGVHYDSATARFVFVYQRITATARSLMVTTVDQQGNFKRRVAVLAADMGVLLSPILVTPAETDKYLYAFLSEFSQGSVTTRAIKLDVLTPIEKNSEVYTWPGKPKFFVLPQAALTSGKRVFLYTFSLFPAVDEQRFISRLIFKMGKGFGGMKLAVLRNRNTNGLNGAVNFSALMGSENSEDLELLVHDNSLAKELRGLTYDTTLRQTTYQSDLTQEAGVTGKEALLFKATGRNDMIAWVEKDALKYTIKMAELDEFMEIVPGTTIELYSHPTQPISGLTVQPSADGEKLFVAWTIHLDNGKSRIHIGSTPL
jgi:hypothetical protein